MMTNETIQEIAGIQTEFDDLQELLDQTEVQLKELVSKTVSIINKSSWSYKSKAEKISAITMELQRNRKAKAIYDKAIADARAFGVDLSEDI